MFDRLAEWLTFPTTGGHPERMRWVARLMVLVLVIPWTALTVVSVAFGFEPLWMRLVGLGALLLGVASLYYSAWLVERQKPETTRTRAQRQPSLKVQVAGAAVFVGIIAAVGYVLDGIPAAVVMGVLTGIGAVGGVVAARLLGH